MPEESTAADRMALAVAFRYFGAPDTSEAERDAILRAMALRLPSPEAEHASRMLYHRDCEKSEQLTIASLLARPLPNSASDGGRS